MKRQPLALEEEQKVRRVIAAALKRAGLSSTPAQEVEGADRDQVVVEVNITLPGVPPDRQSPPLRMTASLDQLRNGTQREDVQLDQQVYGNIRVDPLRRQLWVDGRLVEVTPREMDLLFFLLRHRNLALTRNQLLDGVWELGFQGDVRTVDTHIKCLRAKLGSFGKQIVTLRKIGYKLEWEQD